MKAYQALDRFQLGRALSPWILTIVARTALSSLRQGKRRATISLDDPGPEGQGSLAERSADPAADPGWWEQRLDVERGFARLSEEHRVILALRVEADLPYALIAETLDVPLGTVMSRLARAREALAEQMAQTKKDER